MMRNTLMLLVFNMHSTTYSLCSKPLHDSLPVENRESNALPALRHMTLAKDERAVLADEVRKHASEDTAVKAWSIENKPKTKSE
jgi:hypothetical protein